MTKLEKLVKHRDAILLAEIGALIHDLGKLSEEFVKSKCVEKSGDWIHHTAIVEYDVYRDISYARKVKQILESIKIKLDNNNVIRLYDFVLGHHKKMWNRNENWDKPENFGYDYTKRKYKKDNILLKYIRASDTFDSEEDKSYSKDLQSICGIYKSTSFGFENNLIEMDELIEERKKVYKTVISWLDTCDFNEIVRKRRKCMNEIRESFSEALGETRRSANDVTLWDHSYMTATLMKALIAQQILDDQFLSRVEDEINKIIKNKNEKKKPKYIIKIGKPFKIFAVGWDFFGFIKQSHKIPDVIGRIRVLEKIKEEVKRIVEEEYALGNSIYDDDFGLYFLIPSIIDDGDLKNVKEKIFDVFNEKVGGIVLPIFHIEPKSDEKSKSKKDKEFRIGKLLVSAIKYTKGELILQHKINLVKTPAWVKSWECSVQLPKDKLICGVCGKGYYCRGDDEKICNACKILRSKGRKSEEPQTVFIDEISWNSNKRRYENVCLLFAKFDLDKWLDGKYVQSLLIRVPDIEKILWLRNFYQSNLCIDNNGNLILSGGNIKKLLSLGALCNYLESKSKEGKNKAKNTAIINQIEKCLEYYNNLDDFSREFLTDVKENLKKAKKLIAEDNVSELQKVFTKLNSKKIISQLKDIIRKVEETVLTLDEQYKQQIIIKNAKNLEDILQKLFQKPPSPSRLMRVWNNTKHFFESVKKEICLKVPLIEEVILKIKDFKFENTIRNKLTKNRAYLIEIKDLGLQGEVICEANCDNPKELTVITPHLSAVLKKEKDKVKDKEIIIKDVDTKKKIATARILEIEKESKNVRAFRAISISPTLFMAIIPAKESVEIVKIIREKYEKHFGKVFGKLPLHIGLIYFKRKMPIFTVLDSASRMLSEFEKLSSDEIKLRVISELKTNDNIILTLTPDSESEQSPIRYEIKIPYKLGDGNIDYYHPYLIVDNTSEDVVEIKLDGETITQKHVSKIKKGDKIVAKKYLLDFEFLDSNIRRFDIGEERKHWLFTASPNKPKPYLLWDIDIFEKLKELIQKLGLTTTQIMNLYEMLIGKIEDWELKKVDDLKNDAFKKLVENAITSIPLRLKVVDGESGKGKISKQDFEFLKTAILNGMFFDFVDLWHTILKKRFEKGEKNE